MLKSILGLVAGLILGIGGYIYFDNVLTPDATVIEAMEGEVLYQGEFMDADPAHKAMGSFMIKGDGMGGRFIELSNDFQVANAPDPHVRINDKVIAKNNWKGGQSFAIPNFIGEEIKSVKIWCEIANIALALEKDMMMDDMKDDMKDGMMMEDKMMDDKDMMDDDMMMDDDKMPKHMQK